MGFNPKGGGGSSTPEITTFLSTDTKATAGVATNSIGLETDTGLWFIFNGTDWVLAPAGGWTAFDNYLDWTTVIVGTGSVSMHIRRMTVGTNNVAGESTLARFDDDRPEWSSGVKGDVLDWSKRIVLLFTIEVGVHTTNGIGRMTLGKNTTEGAGALGDKAIGIEVRDLALHGIVHNGTSGFSTDLSTSLTNAVTSYIIVESDGAGNVTWFVNGANVGTNSNGPTGSSTDNATILQNEVLNGVDNAPQNQSISVVAFVEP